jgi:hypothetical protein
VWSFGEPTRPFGGQRTEWISMALQAMWLLRG